MGYPHSPDAPETWAPARRVAEMVLRPLERFLRVETASAVVLLAASVAALVWANSPWSSSYEALWHAPVTVGVGGLVFRQSLHFVINDGLMTIFFFVVGLEIRRELHEGELADVRRATLPVAAALGGMLAPALIYLALNHAPVLRRGWGVPVATDIAFAVGAMALLGKRVPPALRVLLLALAIIDDIGAILVIAFFYSTGISVLGLIIAACGVAGILSLQRFGVRNALTYVLPGSLVWWGMLRAGVHPTIAGVVIGLLTPAVPWFGKEGFLSATREAIEDAGERMEKGGRDVHGLLKPLRRIKQAHREALPPVVRVQAALHPWVAYGIMPLFALANAGIDLRQLGLGDSSSSTIVFGVVLGLVLGKPFGILLASFVTVKMGISALPKGVTWRGILVVGCVAGIGFTMAIFIAGLAFQEASSLAATKCAVLMASASAAAVGLIVGWLALSRGPTPGAAATVREAETSTEK